MKRKPNEIKPTDKKDWRDAFVESGIITADQKADYSCCDTILIRDCNASSEYSLLCSYVGQFTGGGFWLYNDRLRFVTSGNTGSDEEATYEDAREFLTKWKRN